jgi:hypothetical protein
MEKLVMLPEYQNKFARVSPRNFSVQVLYRFGSNSLRNRLLATLKTMPWLLLRDSLFQQSRQQ